MFGWRSNFARLKLDRRLLAVGLLVLLIVPFNGGIFNRFNLIAAGCLVLITALLVLPGKYRQVSNSDRLLHTSLAVLLIWLFISILWSGDKYNALSTSFMYGVAILAFIIAQFSFTIPLSRRQWLWAYFLIAAIASLIGIHTILETQIVRLLIGLILANSAAAFLLPAIIVYFFGRAELEIGNQKAKFILAIISLVILAGFLLSSSRGAFVCLAMAIILLLGLRHNWRIVLSAGVFFLILIVLALKIISHSASIQDNSSGVVRDAFRSPKGTLHDRKIYAQSAWDIFKAHPILGAGAGSYRGIGITYQYNTYTPSTNAHASGLQFLAEFGLVGGLLLGFVIAQVLQLYWRARKNPNAQAYIFASLALALHFAIDIDLIYPPLLLLLAIISGMSLATIKKPTKR
jgi:O-antigen ligase